jgi:structural maintenance of chromosomes protein 6
MSRKRTEAPSDNVPTNKRRNIEANELAAVGDAADDEDYPDDVSRMVIEEITKLLESHVRSGKIQKMILKNFMCHSNLLVDFNKRVNLLVGNNGSGKSAVLTALIIGLGSKASETDRSSSIKRKCSQNWCYWRLSSLLWSTDLIKNGENSSNIEIHISNDGFDAYDQSVFGKKIIVSRTLMASGGSSYMLKDEKGCVKSKRKSDLMKLTLCLNIQVENPVCVLNQDQARSFLKE